MLLSLIGAAGSVSCLRSDTGDEPVLYYTFRNTTVYSIEMIGYTHVYNSTFSDTPFIKDHIWLIEPNSEVEFSFSYAGVGTLPPNFYDSVQIVFDQTKALMYRQIPHEGDTVAPENAGTIYDPDRYVRTEIDSRRTHFLYEITEADYELAVDITDASSDENLAELMQ